jgi:cell division protein FtsA
MNFKSMRKSLQRVLPETIVSLDIGATKICCYIARLNAAQNIQVIGVGYEASKGIRSGAIVDMEALSISIARAVNTAEQMAQTTVSEVFVTLSAGLTTSHIVDVALSITGHAVDEIDVKKMLNSAAESVRTSSSEIIHTIPISYNVDGTRGIKDPRGMFGDSLGANIHVISSPISLLRNFFACIERCHLDVSAFIVTPYASGLSTLVEDEIDLGVTLIDMGGGSTSIAVFHDGKLIHTDYIPVGGNHVTNDIARGLSTPLIQAERIKILHGSAMVSPVSSMDERSILKVPQIGEEDASKGLQITKSELVRIIRPRIEETFELIRERLKKFSDISTVGKRLVLTGGASQLSGVRELAGLILDKHTRLGKPINIQGVDEKLRGPAFSACAGLLSYAKGEQIVIQAKQRKTPQENYNFFGRIGLWLKENL